MAPAWTSTDLDAAVADACDPRAAPDRRCGACGRLPEADGASISVMDGDEMTGTCATWAARPAARPLLDLVPGRSRS